MFVPVERLLGRRQVPSRAAELVALRRRLRDPAATRAGDGERALAAELRALKLRLAIAIGDVTSCATCARRARRPYSGFPGGDCCGGVTADLFSDDEVAALALAGTRPRHLRAPRDTHAGCAFRAPTGCTLAVAHRPQRCVHYACNLLKRELHARGALDGVEALRDALRDRMARFVELRGARHQAELFASFEEAVLRAAAAAAEPASP